MDGASSGSRINLAGISGTYRCYMDLMYLNGIRNPDSALPRRKIPLAYELETDVSHNSATNKRWLTLSLKAHPWHYVLFHLEWVKAKNLINRRKGDQKNRRTTYSIGRMFPWAVSSRSPLIFFGKAGGRVWILSRQGAAWFDIVVYSDPVEVVFTSA